MFVLLFSLGGYFISSIYTEHPSMHPNLNKQLREIKVNMFLNYHELWKPVLVMILVNLALAFVNVFMKKVLNEGMDHLTILTYRQAISAIFLAPIACFYERLPSTQFFLLYFCL